MRRSDVSIKNADYLQELRQLLQERQRMLEAQLASKEISSFQANKQYLLILQLVELFELLEAKNMALGDVMTNLRKVGKSKGRQGNLFH